MVNARVHFALSCARFFSWKRVLNLTYASYSRLPLCVYDIASDKSLFAISLTFRLRNRLRIKHDVPFVPLLSRFLAPPRPPPPPKKKIDKLFFFFFFFSSSESFFRKENDDKCIVVVWRIVVGRTTVFWVESRLRVSVFQQNKYYY